MPSLADTIKANQGTLTRGPNGELMEQNPEDIQTLSAKAGLPAPPTTAMGAAAIGATPKQQDMMGSGAQKAAALDLSQQTPDQSLQTVLRRQQARSEATGAEQQEMQKSKNLQDLGALGDRVNDFMNAQRKRLEQTGQIQVQTAATGTNASGQVQDLTSIKSDLDALRANPNDMQAMLRVNQALGYDANRQLTGDEINGLYQSSVDAISQGGQAAIDSKLTGKDLGVDTAQIADALGITPEQAAGMTVGQIRDQVNQQMQNEFNKTQQLQQKAQSGELGEAERGAARQGLREASATGLRSSEADVAKLDQQIQNADTVSFNGQQMKIDDLLGNDAVSKTITDYMNAGPDSPLRKQLDQNEPQLSKFIKDHEAVLSDATKALSSGANQFSDIQSSNKALVESSIPADIAKQLIPGYGQLSASKIEENKVPLLAVASHFGPQQQQQFKQDLSEITSRDPNTAAQLATLNQDQIKQLGLDKPASQNPMWKQFTEQQDRYNQIQNANNVDDLVAQVFGPNSSSNYSDDIKQNQINNVLGFGGNSKSLDILDADHDGTIDNLDDIKKRVASGSPSLANTLAGKKQVSDAQDYNSPQSPDKWNDSKYQDDIDGDPNAVKSALNSALGKYAADGSLTPDEINKVYTVKPGSNPRSLQSSIQELTFLQKNGNLDKETDKSVSKLLDQHRDALDSSVVSDVFDMKDFGPMNMNSSGIKEYWGQKLDQLNKVIGKNEDMFGPSVTKLKDKIDELVTTNNQRKRDEITDYLSHILQQRRDGIAG